jgi:hypothetical protein
MTHNSHVSLNPMADLEQGLTNKKLVEHLLRWWRRRSKDAPESSGAQQKRNKASREDLVRRAYESAAAAEAEGDIEKMHRRAYKLIRLELYERAWELRLHAAELMQSSPLPEWDGRDLAGRIILVRAHTPKHRIGEELRMSRFIGPAAQQARRCIVLAEPRLVTLLRRSFARVDARPRGVNDLGAFAEADVAAYYETIALHHARTAEELKRSFLLLRPDFARTAALRARYKYRSTGPLIGIAWGSSNANKVLPPLEAWGGLLEWSSATFVSLQYGDVDYDLAQLRNLGGRIIHDAEIDQMVDLDGFAAQIAALDAVVSISNTTIDMAGMLGMPTVHVRDDIPSAVWPRSGPSPWYPDMIFVYRDGRSWSKVFNEVRVHVENIITAARDK